jgi:hypothetical protein
MITVECRVSVTGRIVATDANITENAVNCVVSLYGFTLTP